MKKIKCLQKENLKKNISDDFDQKKNRINLMDFSLYLKFVKSGTNLEEKDKLIKKILKEKQYKNRFVRSIL